jgi:hypothetical protein
MAKRQLGSEERMELLAYLEALLGCVKSLHASVGEVMADVAAMRSAVLENAEDLGLYQTNLKQETTSARPMVQEAFRSYDDLIAEFAGSQRYKN